MRLTTALALAALLLSCPKPPPDAPARPWGQTACRPGVAYTFRTAGLDPDADSLWFRFGWSDTSLAEWLGPYAPGETAAASRSWPEPGEYSVRAEIRDKHGSVSAWSPPLSFIVGDSANNPPEVSAAPVGPDSGWQLDEYLFYTLSPSDPDGDSMFLRFDWGDGDTGGWRGPLPAGDTAWDEHGWDSTGVQSVRCQAKDTRGAVSAWSAACTFFSRSLIRPKWELFFGGHNDICPAIGSDGTIYVCGEDGVYAVNPDGTIRWQRSSPGGFRADGSVVLGPDGTLHFAQYRQDSADHVVRALHPDGTDRWTYRAGPVATPAVGADGAVYFACGDSTVCALDSTGTLKWRTHVFSNDFADMPPAVGADGSVYLGVLDSLLAFDPSGTRKWARHLHFSPWAGFAIGSDGTICGGEQLTAVRPDGTVLWSGDARAVGAPVIGPDGTIYQETRHDLRAFKPDGTPLWTSRHFFAAYMSTPAVAADGTIYVTSGDGPLVQAIGPSGEELWRGVPWSDWYLDGPVAIGPDGTVYFAGEEGPLCAFAGTSPLANSPWPKYQRDMSNSGRGGGP